MPFDVIFSFLFTFCAPSENTSGNISVANSTTSYLRRSCQLISAVCFDFDMTCHDTKKYEDVQINVLWASKRAILHDKT